MMGCNTACEKVSSASTVRADLFLLQQASEPGVFSWVETKSFIEHVANCFDLFERSNSF